MVWKSPLNQYSRSDDCEDSSSSSQPLLTSPAEIQVREIASRIGLHEDSEILATVCHKMRNEYVVEKWQLPVLDSRQWEKLHAPIGLAVAVQHISAHQIQEQRMQLPFRERVHENVQTIVAKDGEKKCLQTRESKKNDSAVLSNHKDEDRTKTPALSPAKSLKENVEDKIELVSKATFECDSKGLVTDLDTIATKSSSTFEASINASNEKIQDKSSETEKQAGTIEQKKSDEGDNVPLTSDDVKQNNEFSEDCTDWLELDKLAVEEEEQKSFEEEHKCDLERSISIADTSKNEGDGFDEENGGSETTSLFVSNAMDTTEAKIVNRNNTYSEKNREATNILKEAADTSLGFDERQEAKVGASYENRIEQQIDILEKSQAITEAVNRGEQESSMNTVVVERETPKLEIIPIENAHDFISSTKSQNAEEKESLFVETPDGQQRDTVATSMQIGEILVADIGVTKREEPPETRSSDSESEGNTNIFSGIATSVSFSEDEEERPGDKGASTLGCLLDQLDSTEDSAISSRDDTETNLLLIPDYGADDITVAISNISPECKKSAAERNKQSRKYHHEYDREAGATSLQIDTTALQEILVQLPDDDHRAILSQLMIMTNARDKVSRHNLALQVQESLVDLVERNQMDVEPTKAVQLIFQLSRLKKSYRLIFGKSLFKAMSKLYKRTEKLNKKKSPKKKQAKKSSLERKSQAQDDQEMEHIGTVKDKITPVDSVRLKI